MERERIGKYEIVGELGRGTMGEVYEARDTVLKRSVALKTLVVRGAPGDETLDRFKREAQAAALLKATLMTPPSALPGGARGALQRLPRPAFLR